MEPNNDESVSLMSPSLSSTGHISTTSQKIRKITDFEPSPRVTAAQRVKWGIYWKQPISIIVFFLAGVFLAIGHHLYYRFLDGTTASSPDSQQWALRFGTAFAFLTIASLRAAIAASYNQYIWMVFRRKSVSIGGIDNIFALGSDFMGFCNLELYRQAWCLPLAGITPAATISVVTALHPSVNDYGVKTLNLNVGDFSTGRDEAAQYGPTLITATRTAEGMIILPMIAPASNSSYSLQFDGPTLQCSSANKSEQGGFDYYNAKAWNESQIFIPYPVVQSAEQSEVKTIELNIDFIRLLVYSAFIPDAAPFSESGDWDEGPTNYWDPELPAQFTQLNTRDVDHGVHLWVQTAEGSTVCTLSNATFDVRFEFLDGVQTVYHTKVEVANAWEGQSDMYSTIFKAYSSMLLGNVSIDSSGDIFEDSSNILYTGLIACNEFSYWNNTNLTALLGLPDGLGPAFPITSSPWMCRNQTLESAIEDLANNITISLLSNPKFSASTTVPVSILTSGNVYQYNSKNLIISYATAICVTFVTVLVGLYALHTNGASHSASFSAIVATTRNTKLDELFRGTSLGAEPLPKHLGDVKLQFGAIVDSATLEHDNGGSVRHLGFSLEGNVSKLQMGQVCY
ncbi:hypothetical protein MMC27_000711 [Xylographa pallens]|nr:hypothetical protein [Xylographa pallens]